MQTQTPMQTPRPRTFPPDLPLRSPSDLFPRLFLLVTFRFSVFPPLTPSKRVAFPRRKLLYARGDAVTGIMERGGPELLCRESGGDDKQRVDSQRDEEGAADAAEQKDDVAGDGKLVGKP